MPIRYEDLDATTRRHMVAELERDVAAGKVYLSARLTEEGQRMYPVLLREAIEHHDGAWLSTEIARRGYLKSHEERKKPRGGVTLARVPATAHLTLGEGEFNRFYCRGLCARAIETGVVDVEVYRGQEADNPRPESQALIGRRFAPAKILEDLRTAIAAETAFGVPAGPNSGLTLRLPR